MRNIGALVLAIATCLTIALFALSTTAWAGSKMRGTTNLMEFQPAGTTDKNHKNQQYDLSFAASGKEYTCRTNPKKSVKATEFVVGTEVKYEIDGDKGKVKNSAGKQIECTVVRVAALPAP